MKRSLVIVLAMVLVAGFTGAAQAKRKKPKPKPAALVSVDQPMYLRGDACTQEARALSVADAEDAECFYTAAGLQYETGVREGLPAPAGSMRDHTWPARDGIPFKLDATKPVTGEIHTEGGSCPVAGTCSPVTVSAGEVTITVKLIGEANGAEQTLGEQVDEFSTSPGTQHTTAVSIQPDAALNGLDFTSLTLVTTITGVSVGHGVYKLGEPSSFISIPTLVSSQPLPATG